MFTATGDIVNFYVAPQVLADDQSADGSREEDYMNLTVRAMSDEKEYQFSWSTLTGPQIGEQQLRDWQKAGQKITVFASGVRAIPFGMDRTAKDDEGKPKMYMTAGKKVTVGKATIEIGTLISFSAYALEPAAETLLKQGEKAHGDYLEQRAKMRQQGNIKRIEKARKKAADRKQELAKARRAG